MSNTILNNINTILAAMGSKPYSIKKLTLDDLVNSSDYSLGIKNLVENLVEAEEDGITYFYIDKRNRLNNFLYRASSDKNMEAFLFTPGERTSEGTANVYNRLISDILPSWKNIPKRSNSIVCSNNYHTATEYLDYGKRVEGVIYLVIPPNNARIVVSPSGDIWYAFDRIKTEVKIERLDSFNDSMLVFLAFFYEFIVNKNLVDEIVTLTRSTTALLKDIMKNEVENIQKLEDIFAKQDKSAIINIFNMIDQLLSNKKLKYKLLPIYRKYADENPMPNVGNYIINRKVSNPGISILEILDELFDPDDNGFDVLNYSSFLENVWPTCEAWTDQPCIFIDADNYEFLTAIKNRFF